jgi:NADPH:quinone reductase-like Zn-dependent oxidoreductase
MSTHNMQAIRVHAYGAPDQLKYEQAPRPEPEQGEVLVRVHAAGVNPADWKVRQGLFKDFAPSQFPYIPGADVAGVVVKVGPGVTNFQEEQMVYGRSSKGSYAEYATAPASALATKPQSLSFDEAAAVPVGATTAWQALFDNGGLQAGQRVLILGAAGGVGLFAVQFARWKGAHVIGTASTSNVEFVRSLGAETVFDYTTTAVEQTVHDVDLAVDTVGGKALESALPTLKRGGTIVSIAGRVPEEKVQQFGIRPAYMSAVISSELLQQFASLIDEGQVKVFIQQVFSLDKASQAHEISQGGHGRGRIVLHVAD